MQTVSLNERVWIAALSELDQFDKMINWMLATYFACLGLGWGLLLFDWAWNKTHHLHSQVWHNYSRTAVIVRCKRTFMQDKL